MTAKRYVVDESVKEREAQKKETLQLYVSFGLMIVLSSIAFITVGSGAFSATFIVPFIFLLALVQFTLQLFIFMSLKDKGSEYPILFFFSGMFAALLTVASMMFLIWW